MTTAAVRLLVSPLGGTRAADLAPPGSARRRLSSARRARRALARAVLLLSPLWVVGLRNALPEALALYPLAPDAALAAAAAAAWVAPPLHAVLFAAVLGLLTDAPTACALGVRPALLVGVVTVLAYLRSAVAPGGPLAHAAATFGVAAAERTLAAAALLVLVPDAQGLGAAGLGALLARAAGVAAWTALLGPPLFFAARALVAEAGLRGPRQARSR